MLPVRPLPGLCLGQGGAGEVRGWHSPPRSVADTESENLIEHWAPLCAPVAGAIVAPVGKKISAYILNTCSDDINKGLMNGQILNHEV